MKKKFWLIGVTLTFLVSCTTNEVIDMPKGGTIGFDTYVGKASRAAVAATTANLNEMYVVGYMTDNEDDAAFAADNYDPVFNDENTNFIKATRNSTSGAWGYTPIKYWQKKKFYRFAAFTDANDGASDLTNNIAYNPVADNLTITNMEMSPNTKDLVVAISGDRKTSEALSAPEVTVIPFAFRHAYSRIRITFTDAANVELKVTDLKIVNASTTGTGTFAFSQISSVGKNDVIWNMTGYDGTGYEFPTEQICLTGSTPVFDEIFVLPQSLYGADEEPYDPSENESVDNDVKLSFKLVSYTIEDDDEKVIHETPIELPLAAANVDCWESGMWYQYQIAFGTSYNEIPISFSVSTVHGWSTNLDGDPTTTDGQIDLGSTGVSQ